MTPNAYEFTWNPDLPPLGEMHLINGKTYWDRGGNNEVDFDALVKAGYCRPVRITTTKEYL